MNKIAAPWAALLAASIAVAASAGDFSAGTLTNADIIGFAHSNISPSLIISRIHTSNTAFDLSDNAISILRQNGVNEDVLEAMRSTSGSSLSLGRVPAVRDLTVIQQPVPQSAAAAAPASVESRFDVEFANLVEGGPETQRTAMAWMLANRERTLPMLRKSLGDSKPEAQAAALRALGDLKDRENIVQMRRLLASPEPKVRQSAALALAGLEDAEAIAASEKVLNQPLDPLDGYIRLVGAARLVRAAGDLAKILSDSPSAGNRAAAAWSLAEIGRSGAVAWPALEHALVNDADPRVRRETVRAVAAFHDASSARLLRDACRRDPEVRKATLKAMAEYPETIGFLVEVMNRGTDQIAADELETARASLQRLTGEDMGLDGQRWSAWYDDNKSRFPAPGESALAGGSAERERDFGFLDSLAGGTGGTASSSGQPDITDFGVLMDPSLIPMAPEVDDRGPSRAGLGATGLAGGLSLPQSTPGLGTTTSPEAIPPSPGDFADGFGSPSGTGGFSGTPGAGEAQGEAPLRTWSSDTGRLASGSAGAASSGAGPETPQPYAYSFGAEPSPEPFSAPSATAQSSSLLPSEPIVSPQPAAASPSPGAGLTGISLPLPPMGGLSGGSSGPAPDFPGAASSEGPAPAFAAGADASPYSTATLAPQTADAAPGADGDIFGEAFSTPFPDHDDVFADGASDADTLVPGAASETAGLAAPSGYDESDPFGAFDSAEDADGFDAPEESAAAGSQPAPPPAASPLAPPPPGDYSTLAFPDDDTFGIGGSYFDGPPAPPFESAPAGGDSPSLSGMNEGDAGTASLIPPPAAASSPSLSPPSGGGGIRPPAPAPAPPTIIADTEIPDTIRFAEPRPGQVVLGDNILGHGSAADINLSPDEYVIDDFPPDVYGQPRLPRGKPTAAASPSPTPAPAASVLRPPPAGGGAQPPAPAFEEAPIGAEPEPEAEHEAEMTPGEESPALVGSHATPGPTSSDGVVSELWDGPEEFYQSLDELEGVENFEVVGTGEAQITQFVGPDVDFTEATDADADAAAGSEFPEPGFIEPTPQSPATPVPDSQPPAELPNAEPGSDAGAGSGSLRLQIPPM